MFGLGLFGRGVAPVSRIHLLRSAHGEDGPETGLGSDGFLGSRVGGRWDGLKPWVSTKGYSNHTLGQHGPFDLPWFVFEFVLTYGCTNGRDELELGSRVCSALCIENCP